MWSSDELEVALRGPVATVLFDDEGRANVEEILAGLAETEFQQGELRRILALPQNVENWRVGEAIAEVYLTCHRSCYFPWPDGRDERKVGSSLPGADLIGFGTDDRGDCIAFGEVKSSSQRTYPPTSMNGRTGLRRQVEDLRDSDSIRDTLLKYLAHRVEGSSWRPRFECATRRYLQDKSDVQIYGVLIRDVPPNSLDLSARVQDLRSDCPNGTRIELLAIYLPERCIEDVGAVATAMKQGTSQ